MYNIINITDKTIYMEDFELGDAIYLQPKCSKKVDVITKEMKFAVSNGLLDIKSIADCPDINEVKESGKYESEYECVSEGKYIGPNQTMYKDGDVCPETDSLQDEEDSLYSEHDSIKNALHGEQVEDNIKNNLQEIIESGKWKDKVDWENISQSQKLSEEFIEKHKDLVNWINISTHQKLSESFIEKHKDKVSWTNISRYQKLSESFIEKHPDKVDWDYISRYQILSEEFIEKYKIRVHWNIISQYQKLSKEFIEKHSDYIDLNTIKFKNNLKTLSGEPDSVKLESTEIKKDEFIVRLYNLDLGD